jgi:DNA-binding response OmpR family regulator
MVKDNTNDHLQVPNKEDNKTLKKVLILDDDRWFTDLIAEMLATKQMSVTTTENGVDGLKEIMKSDFDVILCDMMMPGLTGDMFYKAVERAKPSMCNRFIFMSGHRDKKEIVDFINSVGKKILWKPFDLYQLLEAINTLEISNRG